MAVQELLANLLLGALFAGLAAACSIANCEPSKCQVLGGQDSRCLGCAEGFRLEGETACLACAAGCTKCSASGQCQACLDGYLLTTAADCTKCGEHCLKCDEKACLACVEGSFELADGACRSTAGTGSSISGPTIGYILLGVFVGLFLLFLVRVNFVKKKSSEVQPYAKEAPVKGILKSPDGDTLRTGGRLVTTSEHNPGDPATQDLEKKTEADTKASSSSQPSKPSLRSAQDKLAQESLAEAPSLHKKPQPAAEEPPFAPDEEAGREKPARGIFSPSHSPQVVVRKVAVKQAARSPPNSRKSPNLKLAQRKVLGYQVQRISFPYLGNKKPANWSPAEVDEVPVQREEQSGPK